MENINTEITDNPQPLFSRAFAYDGRIRRLEYCLSILIGATVICITEYLPKYFFTIGLDSNEPIFSEERANTEAFVKSICIWIYCVTCWFLWAQSTKRCHDIGESGWIQFIPFYNLKLFFVESDSKNNRYGYPPKQRISVDSQLIHKNIMKEKNTFATVFLIMMIILYSDILVQAANNIRLMYLVFKDTSITSFSLISTYALVFVNIFVQLVALIGFVLVFHYKKAGFYIAIIASAILFLFGIYSIVAYLSLDTGETVLYQIFIWIITIIHWFGCIAVYPILNIKKDGESIWQKMEVSFKDTDWKSFFQYLFTFQAAFLINYIAHF